MMLPIAPPSTRPNASWSPRRFSRMIQTATAMAIATVRTTRPQRIAGLVALSSPSEIPRFSIQVRLKKGSSTICRTDCNCSGTVTSHLVNWSARRISKATPKARRRSIMDHRLAARAEPAVVLHLGQMPPAAAAFFEFGLGHGQPVAFRHLRGDEQLGEIGAEVGFGKLDLGLEARPKDLVPAQRFDRLGHR